jgi:hypothetical protein
VPPPAPTVTETGPVTGILLAIAHPPLPELVSGVEEVPPAIAPDVDE